MRKTSLGKGLDALIPKDNFIEGYIFVSVNELRPNPNQPRKKFDEESISLLASSIKEKGVIQPLIVRKLNGTYQIVAGERRWRAAQKVGTSKIPIIVMDLSDSESLELALIENLQRKDLNPIEEAEGYKQLIEEFELTHDQISKLTGKDRSTITNLLRLLKLPEIAKNELISEAITSGHARALLKIEEDQLIIEAITQIKKQNLSVRQTERLVEKKPELNPGPQINKDRLNPYLKEIRDGLVRVLGTNVNIIDKNGTGRIEIEYYSQEELERLIALLKDSAD
ncbi:MAG: ParB/RepB/Spo0J family partition protein [Thermodesulfobacteriota bacterium]